MIPYFGGIDYEHLEAVQALRKAGAPLLRSNGVPYIDHARAVLATKAIEESDAEVFMWIDHDMIFKHEDVEPMVDRLLASEYDMIGAAYSTKRPQGMIVGAVAEGITGITFYRPGLVEADALGFGFTAVRRSCFERIAETMPQVHCGSVNRKVWPFFHHIVDDAVYLGEDYSFCRRVKEAGMRIAIDAEPRVWHKGSYCYSLEDTAAVVPNLEQMKTTFHSAEEHGPHLLSVGDPPKAAE